MDNIYIVPKEDDHSEQTGALSGCSRPERKNAAKRQDSLCLDP